MKRRGWLKLGVASAALLAAGGGLLALVEPGLREARLTPAGRAVFSGVGRAMLDGSLPVDGTARQSALAGMLERVDVLVMGLPAHAQDELSQLLALLASGAGRRTLAGLSGDWSTASIPEIQEALQSMRVSGLSLRQQAYQALHDITGSAYFSDASTWGLLGYPGPMNI
ncbi:MAG: hypothetical protein ABIT82_06050 [Ramlibacter sp.]